MNSSSNENELEIINPETIVNKPIRRTTKIQFENESEEPVTEIQSYKNNYDNYGSTVKIDLESNGRFGNPKHTIEARSFCEVAGGSSSSKARK